VTIVEIDEETYEEVSIKDFFLNLLKTISGGLVSNMPIARVY